MKILYMLATSGMHGSTLSFLSLVRAMRARGEEVVVVMPEHSDELDKIFSSLNVKVRIIHNLTHYLYYDMEGVSKAKCTYRMCKRFVRWGINYRQMMKIAKEEKPDIIHSNVGPLRLGFIVARRLGIPHVWHIREYGDIDFNMREFPTRRYFLHLLSKGTTISITKDIRSHNGLENHPLAHVIYNGVRPRDDVYFDSPKEQYFLCASQVQRAKGHDDVLKAFARFHDLHPSWKLLIIGRYYEPFISELKQFVADHHLNDVVSFEGHKSNVTDYMRRARALIVASHFEGFGRMTAEASFAGCMVIGRATGGTLEIMQQTGGLLFNNNDELLSAMEQAASMPEAQYKESVLHAQHIAQQLFSEEAYVDNVYSVYNEIVRGGAKFLSLPLRQIETTFIALEAPKPLRSQISIFSKRHSLRA